MSSDMDEDVATSDYLSPRSKVAKMLADIDAAPTPSPTGPREALITASETHQRGTACDEPIHGDDESVENDEDDLDLSPVRPKGRTLQRMLQGPVSTVQQPDDDLYAATPIRPTRFSDTASLLHSASPLPRQHGQGLFVSPARSADIDSEDDLPSDPLTTSSRLQHLVAVKRAERLAREAANQHSEDIGIAESAQPSSDLPEHMIEDGSTVNREDDRILSDAARPTRKASKKAMLEMERETQRLAREQALAHQMKTKKKFSKTDLFAKFNYMQTRQVEPTSESSSAFNSDGIESQSGRVQREPMSTPPSSPPTPWDAQKAMVDRGALSKMRPVREDSITSLSAIPIDYENLSFVEDIGSQSQAAKAIATQCLESPTRSARRHRTQRFARTHMQDEDDGSELDIIQPMPQHLRVFDRIKPVGRGGETHSKAIHRLKHLAHLNADNAPQSRKPVKAVVPKDHVDAQLLAAANAHARQAQQQRLAELQAKGIVVMSAEDQEKETDQIENLLEKARREAEDLRKKEKAAARNENDLAPSDDEDEDIDWQESGSEEDANADEDEDELDHDGLLDQTAEDSSGDEEDNVSQVDDLVIRDAQGEEDSISHPDASIAGDTSDESHRVLALRKTRVIQDEDDDDDLPTTNTKHNATTNTQGEDLFAAFGFDNDGPSLMSPNQAFAATMQTPTQFTQALEGRMSARGYFDSDERLPPPTFGDIQSQQALDDSQSQLVPASQLQEETQDIDLGWDTQLLPETPLPGIKFLATPSHDTPDWMPSQDAGLPTPWAAARRGQYVFAASEHETQSTVRVRVSESPVAVPRKGKLTRGVRQVDSSDDETELASVRSRPKDKQNAFTEMQRLRLQSLNATDRAAAEKEMKEMMDDQAEESEDEYAGLGGDDSNMIAPETEEDRAMIDETHIEVDERETAKFFAERQRAAEEEATSKLFKDLTTGALRRRQGIGWELDEDEDEIAARRRQLRQREEARKRRLLLQDDNVKGLLEGKGDSKGKEAFLRTIGDDDDMLEMDVEPEIVTSTPEEGAMPLHEISSNKRQMPASQDMPPAKIRRTNDSEAFSRPTSMLQVRESLSFLLDEPEHILHGPTTVDEPDQYERDDSEASEDEEEESRRDNDGGFVPDALASKDMPPPPLPTERLPASQRRTPAVIDRLSLRRGSSSSSSSSLSAWSTGPAASKVPSLLRRATSNLSASNVNDRGVSHSNGDRGSSTATKSGGSKKSSLAYQSRAEERKLLNERAQKKRDDNQRKMAELKRQQSGGLVGGLQSGEWE